MVLNYKTFKRIKEKIRNHLDDWKSRQDINTFRHSVLDVRNTLKYPLDRYFLPWEK